MMTLNICYFSTKNNLKEEKHAFCNCGSSYSYFLHSPYLSFVLCYDTVKLIN